MKKKTNAKLQIIVSLAFAVAIVVSSFVFNDKPYQDTVTFILIAIWWVPFTYLLIDQKKCCSKDEEDKS